MTHTQAAAPVLQGSAGSAVTPAASSTRCRCQAGLGAKAYTVKVCPHCTLLALSPPFSAWYVGSQVSWDLVFFPHIK